MGSMTKIFNWFKNLIIKTKDTAKRGKDWIGTDGLINMETAALLTIFFMILFPTLWAMAFSFIVIMIKCALDKSKGHEDEKHDLICACIGVLGGVILGMTHTAVILTL